MEYVKPFTYFAGATGGFVNTLLCAVCQFIPIIGPIVLLGYRAEVAEELVRDKRLRRHPAFDFNRFGEYLTRGVWPFVYQLVVGIGAATVIVGGMVLVGLGVAAAGPPADPTLATVVFAVGYLAVIFGMTVVSAFVLWPMELHAQFSQRFAPVEAFGFATRFQRLVWGQTLTSLLAFLLGSVVVIVCGLLLCFVGVYLAVVVQFMAQQHLMTQLYRLYLDAGGDPIPTPDDEYEDDDDLE